MVVFRKKILFYLFALLFFSCNEKSESDKLIEIINYQNRNFNDFLQFEINSKLNFIEDKVMDYPYKKESFTELQKLNQKIDYFVHLKKYNSKELNAIYFFERSLQIDGKVINFNSLKINNDSLFINLIRNDLLRVKYELNTKYIKEHCNIVE